MCFGSSDSGGEKRYVQETPPPVPPISPPPIAPMEKRDGSPPAAPAKTTNKGTGLSIPTVV